MTDSEKVITHLQIIHTWAEFARERDLQFFTPKHLENIAKWTDDALELLKEQEAVEPSVSSVEQRCGNCNKVIEMDGWQSCPWCGKRIDWNGWWKKNGTRNQDS